MLSAILHLFGRQWLFSAFCYSERRPKRITLYTASVLSPISRIARLCFPLAIATLFCHVQSADLAQCPTLANWDASKSGPLLVLEPDKVKSKTGTNLADFKRKLVEIGGIHAIVPDTMVIIDESGLSNPDLYDGLPMHSKVLYLLSTLDKGQFGKVSGDGLCLTDLRDEQVRVLDSILPKPFKFEKTASGVSTKTTLSDADRTKVKLKVSRFVAFMLQSNEGGYSQFSANRGMSNIANPTYRRDISAEFDTPNTLGVTLKKSVPNNVKASDIDYKSPALDKQIDLLPTEKTIDLLKRIERSTGRELFADIRVANRMVVSKGGKAKAGDVLQAIAFCVTGTYRKVGSMYLLTSDLTGLGTRAVRIALWNGKLRKSIWEQESRWREKLAQSGAMSKVGFDSKDPLAPNDSVKNYLEANRQNIYPMKFDFDFTKLPANAQDFLRKQNEMYESRYTFDKVSLEAGIGYGFVLPDGNNLVLEHQDFGPLDMFEPRNRQAAEPPEEVKGNFDLASVKGQKPLALKLADKSQAAKAVTTAKAYGFSELWIESRSKQTIEEAVKRGKTSGIAVRLVVQPFALGEESTKGEDLSILGENGNQIGKRILDRAMSESIKDMLPPKPISRTLCPETAMSPSWINRFVDLAKTGDLAGIVVLDTLPRGYTKQRISGTSLQPFAQALFGYSLNAREQSIRRSSIDPIDIAPEECYTGADLRQPFFLDDGLRGGNSTYDGRDVPLPEIYNFNAAYSKTLSESNEKATLAILNQLSDAAGTIPVWVEARFGQSNPLETITALLEWKKGMKLAQVSPETENGIAGCLALVMPAPTKRDANTFKWWGGVCGYTESDSRFGFVAHNALGIGLNQLDSYLSLLFKRQL